MLVSSWLPCNADAPAAAAGVHVVVGVPSVADFPTSTGFHSVPGVLFIDIVTILLLFVGIQNVAAHNSKSPHCLLNRCSSPDFARNTAKTMDSDF